MHLQDSEPGDKNSIDFCQQLFDNRTARLLVVQLG